MLFNLILSKQTLRRVILSLLIILAKCYPISGQIIVRTAFETSTLSSNANPFFNKHSDIKSVELYYENDLPNLLKIYYHDNPSTPVFQYDLSFDGDLYQFNRRYPEFPIIPVTKLKMTYIKGIRNLGDSTVIYSTTTKLQKDSISHKFSFYTVTGDTKADLDPNLGPFFRGDIKRLQ